MKFKSLLLIFIFLTGCQSFQAIKKKFSAFDKHVSKKIDSYSSENQLTRRQKKELSERVYSLITQHQIKKEFKILNKNSREKLDQFLKESLEQIQKENLEKQLQKLIKD